MIKKFLKKIGILYGKVYLPAWKLEPHLRRHDSYHNKADTKTIVILHNHI